MAHYSLITYKFQELAWSFLISLKVHFPMLTKLSFSTWNIHGLFNNILGDKSINQDFVDNITNLDFIFLTETWCNTNIEIPGFRTFVSDIASPHTDRSCRRSGGIALLAKTKFEKFTTITKKSKNFLWCKVSKTMLNSENDLFLCGVYIPPEKSDYFDDEIFDELENDITSFARKGNVMILGDLNARTATSADFISKDGNEFIKIPLKTHYNQQNDKILIIISIIMVNSVLIYAKTLISKF